MTGSAFPSPGLLGNFLTQPADRNTETVTDAGAGAIKTNLCQSLNP